MIHVVHFHNYPIFQQLQLEEALLRCDENNWCIINEGSPPAIVMGIAGKKEELIHSSLLQKRSLPIIKRFSGGGCVIVDNNTIFITFILSKTNFHPFLSAEELHHYIFLFYQKIFPLMRLQENDYIINDRKCGGNAQYIMPKRCLHHTSFLWDYADENMQFLSMPEKMPLYRRKRNHTDFLCKLKNHFSSKKIFLQKFLEELHQNYKVKEIKKNDLLQRCFPTHRKTTILV